jgi:23S rRNA (guanine2445-N2)-methyltransferase / 23S rRNA (guanine2069-N7)-methyltransferase
MYIATVTRGAENVLADELTELGMKDIRTFRGAVGFHGGLNDAYRACMYSRVASRILSRIKRVGAYNADELYENIKGLRWSEHLGPEQTFSVDFVGVSPSIRNSHFGAQRTKDAVVDAIRDNTGQRPGVDTDDPDVRIHIHLDQGKAAVAIDLTGPPLHLRGGRIDGGHAPLKENLAAALLRMADWPARAERGEPLFDPMCGSGTLLTEAAAMAAGRPAGLHRERWGFSQWRGHSPDKWSEVVTAAQAHEDKPIPLIRGSDRDPRQIEAATANIGATGLPIDLYKADFIAAAPRNEGPGMMIVNPPYGERIGNRDELGQLYRDIGDILRRRFLSWTAFLLTTPELAKYVGLRPKRRHVLHNGPLECRFLEIPISDRPVHRDAASA